MEKFGLCEFRVNDLVLYTFREETASDGTIYEVFKVLPNKDGSFEDRPYIENYWIRNLKTQEEYLVLHSELKLKK